MPSSPQEKQGNGKVQPVSDETILKISKEIAIKFIEVGRLTPATFDQIFKEIHATVKQSSKSK